MSAIKLLLKTSDNKKVEFDSQVLAEHSILIENMMSETSSKKTELILPFHNIHSGTLERMK
jgi:hypothetical protein